LVDRSVDPWLAYWADVRRERSKAARPTPLRDIVCFVLCVVVWFEESCIEDEIKGVVEGMG
jgi:hypothetical protein